MPRRLKESTANKYFGKSLLSNTARKVAARCARDLPGVRRPHSHYEYGWDVFAIDRLFGAITYHLFVWFDCGNHSEIRCVDLTQLKS